MKFVKFKITTKSREGKKKITSKLVKGKSIHFFGSQRKSIHPNCFSPLLFFLWVTKNGITFLF